MVFDRFQFSLGLLPVLFLVFIVTPINSVILSGSSDSFARFPKWAQTFENQLSLEFKTKTKNCILLYTDDGGIQGNFYVLTIVDGYLQLDFRLGDSNQDILIERPVNSIRLEQPKVDDGKWHKFVLFQAWENVKVQLDDTVVFKILTQRSFVFGNLRTNSDLFIGGLPNDIHQLGQMSSPLRRHTKRFAGSVKNLVYRLYPQGVSSPQMISSQGTRLTDDDYCLHESPCKNEARCYSTNDGAACDCSFTEFEGSICENKKPSPALSFFGHEWIGYDVTNFTSAVVQNRFENISIQFRTAYPNGLLFAAGDKSSHVQLVIERGVLIASSKLFGTEKRLIRMFNRKSHPARFDDDQWHEVILYRDVQLMRLEVDGQKDEVKQFSGDTEWLGNSFAYVGGSLPHRPYIPGFSQSFRGCMKKIRYEADAQLLDVIELADQGFGQSVIRTGGDLSFSCQAGRLGPAPDVLSFNSGTYVVALSKWNSPSGGSLGFQFRTGEPDALVLFHGPKRPYNQTHGDYIAFEIVDGHLFLILNLGSGVVRLQTTAQRVDDPRVWHSVQLERLARGGTVTVDHLKTDFSTPGVSANLHVEEPIFIGGLPWKEYEPLATIWNAQLKKGFIGCLKNVRINGINAQITRLFSEQASNSTWKDDVTIGCPSLSGSDYCAADPCMNGAGCRNGHTTFRCDCARTHFEGPRCDDEPLVFSFVRRQGDGPRIRLTKQKLTQAEDIDIKFRTEDERAVLIDTNCFNNSDRFRLSLDRGKFQLRLSINGSRQNYAWGDGLNDNQWHNVRIRRRGEKLKLFVDGKWENHYTLPQDHINLYIDEISVAEPLKSYDGDSEETIDNDDFSGDMIRATFNELDLLEDIRLRSKENPNSEERNSGQRLKHRKVKSSTVWFGTPDGHLTFPIFKNETKSGLKLSLKFRTLSNKALLGLLSNENGFESIGIQLIDGFLKITRISGKQLKNSIIKSKKWNDLKWHTFHLTEFNDGLRLTIENQSTEIENIQKFENKGKLFIGGIPSDVDWPSGLNPTGGFKGCLAALKLGTELLDLWSDAETGSQVEKGCRAPPNRCNSNTCKNSGVCQQSWTTVNCDCSMTPFSGDYCDELGTTFEFDGDGSCIYHEFPANQRPSTVHDSLVLGFQTEQSNGVLVGVQCGVDGDFLTLYLGGGHLQVKFSLGSQTHHVKLPDENLHDSRWHTVKLRRRAANLTIQLDNKIPVKYYPKDGLATLNTQWRVSVGASFNSLHSTSRIRHRRHVRVFDEFKGKISGINFNGIRILDFFANGGDSVFSVGRPKLVHMATSSQGLESGLFSRVDPTVDGFFSAGPLDCLAGENRHDCIIEDSDNGFFTPIVPQILAETTTKKLTTSTTLIPSTLPPTKTTVIIQPETTIFAKAIFETARVQPRSTKAPTGSTVPQEPPCPPETSSTTTKSVRVASSGPHELDKLWIDVESKSKWNRKTTTPDPNPKPTPKSSSGTTLKYLKVITTKKTKFEIDKDVPLYDSNDSESEDEDESGLPKGDAIDRPITLHLHEYGPSTTTKSILRMPTTPDSDLSMYAVRPTTPMGPFLTTTQPYSINANTDFPRTPMILIASGLVIAIISICVIWVFCCRQQGQNSPDSKPPPSAIAAGYAPIPSEPSPPDPRCHENTTLPLNGHCNGKTVSNGISAPLLLSQPPPERKKDFKEWYV